MTPIDIYNEVLTFSGIPTTKICDLHSACSPAKKKIYLCNHAGSNTSVINFDEVKTLADIKRGLDARKSVDALTVSPSKAYLCFVELKSWELLIAHNGTETNIRRQAIKYSADLPLKLSESMLICREITNNPTAFNDCKVLYILLTDIRVVDDGLQAFSSNMEVLSGISSDLRMLCNSLSHGIMNGITTVETRYWECRNFDREFSAL